VVHDTADKTWRHMDFFQYKALLHAQLPRVRCPEHGGRQVSVSWARPGSGFTMLFDALALTFATAMPVAKVAALTREHATRIWRMLEHHVGACRVAGGGLFSGYPTSSPNRPQVAGRSDKAANSHGWRSCRKPIVRGDIETGLLAGRDSPPSRLNARW